VIIFNELVWAMVAEMEIVQIINEISKRFFIVYNVNYFYPILKVAKNSDFYFLIKKELKKSYSKESKWKKGKQKKE
jgi:hypothetical protein